MIGEKDFYEGYPVVHDNADLMGVYDRLAWKWKMDRTDLLGPLAKCWYTPESIAVLTEVFK